jgi:hypothetical protein
VGLRDTIPPENSGLFKARPLWRVLLFWVFNSPEWLRTRLGRLARVIGEDAASSDSRRENHYRTLKALNSRPRRCCGMMQPACGGVTRMGRDALLGGSVRLRIAPDPALHFRGAGARPTGNVRHRSAATANHDNSMTKAAALENPRGLHHVPFESLRYQIGQSLTITFGALIANRNHHCS